MQCLLQTGTSSSPKTKLLQWLQPHGSLSTLPYAGYSLRKTFGLLLLQVGVAFATDVAIAISRKSRRQSSSNTTKSPWSKSYGPGSRIAMARIGGASSWRVLPTTAHKSSVDVSVLVFFVMFVAFLNMAFILGAVWILAFFWRRLQVEGSYSLRYLYYILWEKTVMLLVYCNYMFVSF